MAPNTGSWLLRRPAGTAPARLFCLPYSGVGASMYSRWPQQVGALEICPVQLPGRENRIREPGYRNYQELAEQLAPGLEPYLDRPFGFFGHCGGALAAFATALHLDLLGRHVPSCLFVSSQVVPHRGPYGRFLSMSRVELRDELAGLTRAMGGVPHPDLLDLGVDVLVSDVAANNAYRLEVPVVLRADLHVISWREDEEIAPDRMDGWSDYAHPGRSFAHLLDGRHYAFLDAPPELMGLFESAMAAATARSPHPSASKRRN